jgi:hypothetical protein
VRLRATCIGTLVLLLASCGGSGKARCVAHGIYCNNLPEHKVLRVGWVENVSLGSAPPVLTFRVRTIDVGPKGFAVAASFTNRSQRPLGFPKGTQQSPKNFGLGVFTDAVSVRVEDPGQYLLKATRFTPSLPRVLEPGRTWSGTMSASDPPRNNRWLRVVFGVFFWRGKPPAGFGPYFAYATTHNVRAPGPVGPPASS